MRIGGRRAAAALLLAAALQAGAPGAARAERVTIFAAASTTDALDAAIAAYHDVSGDRAVAVYASSSVLARQIEAGAPAALFLSANAAWMDYLEASGLVARGAVRQPSGAGGAAGLDARNVPDRGGCSQNAFRIRRPVADESPASRTIERIDRRAAPGATSQASA